MLVRAAVTKRAVSLHVGLTLRAVRVQAEAILSPQEVAEVEVVRGLRRLRQGLVRRSGTLRVCHCRAVAPGLRGGRRLFLVALAARTMREENPRLAKRAGYFGAVLGKRSDGELGVCVHLLARPCQDISRE